jgi:hypothetical protein
MKRIGSGLLAALAVALPALLPAGILPAALAFFGQARGLVALAALLAFLDVAWLDGRWLREGVARGLLLLRQRRLTWLLGLAGFAFALAVLPGSRWSGSFSGDEPKYLRMAQSLGWDLDADISGGATEPPDLGQFGRGFRDLLHTTGEAAVGLFRDQAVPDGHVWSLGNWTIAGRHGGRFHVQSPGLSALLAPMWALQRVLPDDRTPELHALLVLALLFGLTLAQTAALAGEVSGSPPAGLLAGLLVTTSAPLLVGGLHFYPEAAAAPLVAWCARHALPTGPPLSAARAFLAGLGCCALLWLHPKYAPLAAVLLLLVGLRTGARWRGLALLGAGALLAVLSRVLYDHRITGLLTPDAFYRRFGSEVYSGASSLGAWKLLAGLAIGPFGHRDGLLVMAPVAAVALLALPVCWREQRRATLSLLLAFSALWLAAAVHEGGAPGPPGRLLAPVATLLAPLLARGLVARRACLPFRWTLGLAALVGASITLAQLGDWRLTVDPYRGLPAAAELAVVLPDAPAAPDLPLHARRQRDALRGLVLASVLALSALGLDRVAPDPGAPWGLARRAVLHVAGFWSIVAAAGALLARVAP